ncbi:hypothetical protein CN510_16880 [Priestia megaterium]|uniref:hypothetical protein n=1 Tax=Priestia megaterium TaxID=1404 RepID=UPI000BFAD94E|nr:hypothetical protein [Priestia megaterium]PES94721.1 hypothetical protein CN510_16880 [Priestia megaterium]
MERDFPSINVNTWVTLKKLENATREEFERYAQFILLLIHKNYNKTRLTKDDGIDGYALLRQNRPYKMKDNDGSSIDVYEFFSIYGPEGKTDWSEKRTKIAKDLKSIVNYSKESKSKIGKWFLITNFDFIHSYEVEIAAMCKEVGIEYELYYPQKMISLLDTPEHIYKALAFVDQAPSPRRKLTDFYFHIFAEESLKLLAEYQSRTTTEQLELVNYINNSLLLYVPEKEYMNYYSNRTMNFRLVNRLLSVYTSLPNEEFFLYHQYSKEQKRFFTYELEEAKNVGIFNDSVISQDEKGDYSLFIKDLKPLHTILVIVRYTIIRSGTYSIEKALSLFHTQEKYWEQWKIKYELG